MANVTDSQATTQHEITPLSGEALISLAQAASLLPGRPNVTTLHRWCTAGTRGLTLESYLVGARRYTSREAVERFLSELNAG